MLDPGGSPMDGAMYHYYGIQAGIGFGTALAIAISYTRNRSILWAIIHGILSWLYVIWSALFHSKQ
jgi:hypothetical protein